MCINYLNFRYVNSICIMRKTTILDCIYTNDLLIVLLIDELSTCLVKKFLIFTVLINCLKKCGEVISYLFYNER